MEIRGRPRFVWKEDGACGIITKKDGKSPKWQKLRRNGAIIASASFRQLPWTSVDARDVLGGRWKMGNYYDKQRKIPKRKKLGRAGEIIASVSFRGHPWASAICEGGGGRWGIIRKIPKNRPNRKKLWRSGVIISSCSFRGRPRRLWTEDGSR